MKIEISAQHIELTDALREFVEKKMAKLDSHAHSIETTHVTLKIEKLDQIAEGRVVVPGHQFIAEAQTEDMYKTIDLLTDKLVKQLTKYKEKLTDHR
ncbi:MAG: ribosome-associated translation inhibitor RaiA [Coxiellaceae bacterium]|nr:ribosome-associated translation inhibitor RaiA [Coxiellaceae bacterium]